MTSYRARTNVVGGAFVTPGTPSPALSFIRVKQVTLNNVTTNQSIWDWLQNGNYMYGAADTAGVVVLNITDPRTATHTATIRNKTPAGAQISTPITDLLILGTTLFACGRNIDWVSPQPGLLTAYDITDPANPTWISTFEPPSMDPLPVVPGSGLGNNWYQGMATDGTYIYIASQFFGLTVMDVSNPAAMVQHGSYELAALQTALGSGVKWETSRIAYDNGWVYLANHGDGVIALDVSTPATPTNPQHYDIPSVNGVQLRARDVMISGTDLFMCNNTVGSTADEERGLCIIDITDPTAVDQSDWRVTSIRDADVDTWNNKGDKPIMGLDYYNNHVFLANGQRGTAAFDVRERNNIHYVGLFGTNTPDETNLYKTKLFDQGSETYAIYGDSKENIQKYNVFIDIVKNA